MVASTFVDAFRFMPSHFSLLLEKAAQTAELAFTALAIALLIAMPLGLWLGHRHRGLFLALGVSTLGRSLPSVVLIGLGIAILGVGFWNNTTALVVLAIAPILTNTYFGVEGVDRDAVEAARGMGLTETQILTRVEVPLGLPLLLAGLRIAAVFVIATATIAGIFGGGGLGEIMARPGDLRTRSGVLAAAHLGRRPRARSPPPHWRSFSAWPHVGWLRGRRVPGRGAHLERRALMFRKHTRRAAKAAFAISFGVALLIGLTACGGGGGGSSNNDDDRCVRAEAGDHCRHEELRRRVHPGPALRAGAGREGLQGHLQEQHRQLRGDRYGVQEQQDQPLSGVHGRDRPRPREGQERAQVGDGYLPGCKELRATEARCAAPQADSVLRQRHLHDAHVDGQEGRPEDDE